MSAVAERERIAALLDKVSAALMVKAVELVTADRDLEGLPKVQMSATFALAAKVVRGEMHQQFADLLPTELYQEITQ
jgi:uncharacterized protein YkwD